MSQSQQSSTSALTWIIGAVITVVLLFAIFAATRFFGANGGNPQAEVLMTPRAGGVAVPTATPAPNIDMSDAGADDTGDKAAPTLSPGTEVLATTPTGKGVPLRVDAGHQMMVMNIYEDGSIFVVMEASGDYDGYPVEVEGDSWYRVRAQDGLAGWVDASMIVITE